MIIIMVIIPNKVPWPNIQMNSNLQKSLPGIGWGAVLWWKAFIFVFGDWEPFWLTSLLLLILFLSFWLKALFCCFFFKAFCLSWKAFWLNSPPPAALSFFIYATGSICNQMLTSKEALFFSQWNGLKFSKLLILCAFREQYFDTSSQIF